MERKIKDASGRTWIVEKQRLPGYVRSGGWVGRTGPMLPATMARIIKGNIERNAVGGAVIFADKEGMTEQSVHVTWQDDVPIEMSFRGERIAYLWEDE